MIGDPLPLPSPSSNGMTNCRVSLGSNRLWKKKEEYLR